MIPSSPTIEMPLEASAIESGSCLLLTIDPLRLVVPRVLVVEVIDYDDLQLDSSLDKNVKMFDWRGFQVPLVDTSVIDPATTLENREDSTIVILHGLIKPSKLPYYAFTTKGSPLLTQASVDNISEDKDQSDLLPAESLRVRIDDEAAVIPKVDYIEKYILENCFS